MIIKAKRLFSRGTLHTNVMIKVQRGQYKCLPNNTDAKENKIVSLVIPGLTDLQVNGGGGVLFNSDATPEGLCEIRNAHARLGTSEIMPTVITDRAEVMEAAVDAVLECHGEPGILGIHIEGPHISLQKKGTHASEYIRPLDNRTLKCIERLRNADIPVILTAAPECNDPELLSAAKSLGAILSVGHSAANAELARSAIKTNFTMATHLFNAMPPMTAREPGLAGAALVSDLYCGCIADGIHVDWDMVKLAFGHRPMHSRTFVVSDAMPTVGGENEFFLYGKRIRLVDGKLINDEGNLAGAHVDMLTSLRNLVNFVDLDLETAISACSDVPRRAIGLQPRDPLKGGNLRDLVFLGDTLHHDEVNASHC